MSRASRWIASIISVLVLSSPGIAAPPALYADPSQPIDERVDDLVGRMTLAKKHAKLSLKMAPEIDRAAEERTRPASARPIEVEAHRSSLHRHSHYGL